MLPAKNTGRTRSVGPAAFDKLLAQYDYTYPESAVALEPSEPRDSAKLLVWDAARKSREFSTFSHIGEYLPPRSVLVLNETKVIPARLEVIKSTGGRVRLLYVAPGHRKDEFNALADRPLEPGQVLTVARASGKIPALHVVSREKDGYVFRLSKPVNSKPNKGRDRMIPLDVFLKYGLTPIPPYLKRTTLGEKELRDKYQTVFAKQLGSVAAPTASLHFTNALLKKLQAAGHDIAYVTLHVNLGTFAPLTAQALAEGRLHEEAYRIDYRTVAFLERAKKEGRPIIPVGTTALRTLEAASDGRGRIKWPESATRLFIRPGYKFAMADGLITNFHVPRSSLLMLVAALVGRKRLLGLYNRALERGFRIFSFGDGMLLLPKRRS